MADEEARSREAKRPRTEVGEAEEEDGSNQAISDNSNIDADDADDAGKQDASDDEIESAAFESSSPDVLWQFLQAAAHAQGIPIEYLLQKIQNSHHPNDNDDDDNDDDDDDDDTMKVEDYPKCPTSLKDVAELIQSDACQRILILAGAGMSVASGIPDFRTPNIGLYDTIPVDRLSATSEQKQQIAMEPSFALDQHLFLENPRICLELLREFILGIRRTKWKATLAHRFVELLHQKYTHKLVRLYTQNIDGLEDQCHQLPRRKVIAVHGSMDRAECAICGAEMDFDTFCTLVETHVKDITHPNDDIAAHQSSSSTKPIPCEQCGRNAVKPSIVLFRGSLPRAFFDHLPNDTQKIDLLLIIGTSLRVVPANTIVRQVSKRCVRVLINREPAGTHLGLQFESTNEAASSTSTSFSRDYFAQGEIDSVIFELAGHLGWRDDLAQYLPNDQLPEKSAKQLRDCLNDTKVKGALPTEETTKTPASSAAVG